MPVKLLDSLDEAISDARKTNKLVLVDFIKLPG